MRGMLREMEDTDYINPDTEHTLDANELRRANKKTQLAVMRTWFYENFEDHAENTPWESAEGGYIWIWGGPFDAHEELGAEFSEIVPDCLIEKLATELNEECPDWAPIPKPGDYDEFLVGDIAQISDYHHNFGSAISDITHLLDMEVSKNVADCFCRLLYVNVITALETYLSDAFINTVVPDQKLMRRFIEFSPAFKGEKFPIADVFKVVDEIEKKAQSHLIVRR